MAYRSLGADDLKMIEKYSDMVYKLSFSLTKNKYDADDIHQENVDRHAIMTLVKADGTESNPNWGVTWHEEIVGRRVTFDEEWFYIEKDELADLRMYGDFYITDCPVNGDWKISFSLSD